MFGLTTKRILTLFTKKRQTLVEQKLTEYMIAGEKTDNQMLHFKLQVETATPTLDQLNIMLSNIGKDKSDLLVAGATSIEDALTKYQHDNQLFRRPCLVDWDKGKVSPYSILLQTRDFSKLL
ncbi:putative redox protein fmp46, mitochondrial [Schizosaccharomyces pombe]|uniref:Putative redox protein fmp46, mitochondrial n=1 Tax=Schizosaccharomyces pombe (strain 972 / ATCC 24843) TaxID=284812 RepID=FMP46_SCHPO|nr:putative electron carrier protein [Schizosaccharomyces pombe]Q9UTA2.1 RecName: Full=Putative redox protein fmp46, mitochondrial; Flags: Precursor [Schizosaccharomyces pombe 972h-]CAB61784.1 mitochondrial electron carrier (predicted) [Schizosaccharomyces pombe]|eukprot:NP_594478.1 putative electron carrier protein [Schizosaccharomyces pombe]